MLGKYFKWRWLIYIVIFSTWGLWLTVQRVNSFDNYIVNDCLHDIRGQRSAVLVLGAGLDKDSKPGALFADRLNTAVDLYEKGLAKKILVSGDGGQYYSEAGAGKDYLLNLGIPAQDIFTDSYPHDTYSSLERAEDSFGLDNFLLVSQDFHLNRSLFIANRLGSQAWGCRADRRYYLNSKSLSRRETFAKIRAWFDINLHLHSRSPQSVKFDINGDGRDSWPQ